MLPKEINIHDLRGEKAAQAFEVFFNLHYAALARTVYRMVKDKDLAEDLTQAVFVMLWEKRAEIEITLSLKSYLYKAAINSALNHLNRNKKIRHQEISEYFENELQSDQGVEEKINFNETENNVQQAIESLPPACKAIFVLSRFEEMSYKEIATHLNISEKTVENQMGKALKILRIRLKDYVQLGLLLLGLKIF